MGLHDFTIYSVLKRNAIVHSQRTALIQGEERITHKQYLERVDNVAKGLTEVGVRKGDRVAILALNSLEYVYLYGACAKLGAILLLVNWRLNPEEIKFVISDGSPKVVFVGKDYQKLAKTAISGIDSIIRCFSMGPPENGFDAFGELMNNDGVSSEGDVGADDPYVIMHTAAVGGRPRGAVLSHSGLLNANFQMVAQWNLTSYDCNISMLPLFHVTGMGCWLMISQVGGTNIILPRVEPESALNMIQQEKVTILASFPPILASLLDKNRELHREVSSLRLVFGLEGPDTVKRLDEETSATFWAVFGQCETCGLVTTAPYLERLGSAGLPCMLSDVRIVDEQGNFAETGRTGEIVVRGPIVFSGYWNLEKETEHTFRGGWHHTGDMGRFDEDGYLYYAGRMPEKELIKPGGENVYPAEVEKVVLEHPLVEEVSVIGVPDQQWGEAIKAVCVLKQGKSLEVAELIEFVASRIARYKKPKHVVFVPGLPKNQDGSIDRVKVKSEHGSA